MTHNWKIYDLKRIISDGVVTKVTYACESEFNGVRTRKIGEFETSGDSNDEDFIPYSNLTEDTVLGWVNNNVDKKSIETHTSSSIAKQIEAIELRTEAQGLPW